MAHVLQTAAPRTTDDRKVLVVHPYCSTRQPPTAIHGLQAMEAKRELACKGWSHSTGRSQGASVEPRCPGMEAKTPGDHPPSLLRAAPSACQNRNCVSLYCNEKMEPRNLHNKHQVLFANSVALDKAGAGPTIPMTLRMHHLLPALFSGTPAPLVPHFVPAVR